MTTARNDAHRVRGFHHPGCSSQLNRPVADMVSRSEYRHELVNGGYQLWPDSRSCLRGYPAGTG